MEGLEEQKESEQDVEIDMEAIKKDISIIVLLEDFCSSGEFTTWLSSF